ERARDDRLDQLLFRRGGKAREIIKLMEVVGNDSGLVVLVSIEGGSGVGIANQPGDAARLVLAISRRVPIRSAKKRGCHRRGLHACANVFQRGESSHPE